MRGGEAAGHVLEEALALSHRVIALWHAAEAEKVLVHAGRRWWEVPALERRLAREV